MPNYSRVEAPGQKVFFTVVTFERQCFLTEEYARNYLHNAMMEARERYPFNVEAICLMPDHLHCIWALPEEDGNFGRRWGIVKRVFTQQFLRDGHQQGMQSESRQKRHEAAVWQRRGWEHVLRDDEDYNHHVEYIHFNPVKHGLVMKPLDWPWSSFHRFVREGLYEANWGSMEPDSIKEMKNIGE